MTTDELVQLAWDALPSAHRQLLSQVGAASWEVVAYGLGQAVDDRLRSAGVGGSDAARMAADNAAIGMWVPELRLVLINDAHPEIRTADGPTREALITWVAWHEWGHALSVSGPPHDPNEGVRLLEIAPKGIGERIRRGHYPRREYLHELTAETYALLMRARVEGRRGRPPWLPDEIYQLMERIGM